MSIGAKRRAREERRRQKDKKKASKAAEYAARMAAGANGKSRGGDAAPRRMGTLVPHAAANCGNTGCTRCFPELEGRRGRSRVRVRAAAKWTRRKTSAVWVRR